MLKTTSQLQKNHDYCRSTSTSLSLKSGMLAKSLRATSSRSERWWTTMATSSTRMEQSTSSLPRNHSWRSCPILFRRQSCQYCYSEKLPSELKYVRQKLWLKLRRSGLQTLKIWGLTPQEVHKIYASFFFSVHIHRYISFFKHFNAY